MDPITHSTTELRYAPVEAYESPSSITAYAFQKRKRGLTEFSYSLERRIPDRLEPAKLRPIINLFIFLLACLSVVSLLTSQPHAMQQVHMQRNLLQVAKDDSEGQKVYYLNLSKEADNPDAIILKMMFAHAYAFHNRGAFGGVCGSSSNHSAIKASTEEQIRFLGLEEEIKFDCPEEGDEVPFEMLHERDGHDANAVALLTPEWQHFMKQRMQQPLPVQWQSKLKQAYLPAEVGHETRSIASFLW
jgi:hypothetical protein